MAAPSVSSISPTAGPIGGGTVVTILGANFTGVVAVTFGATPAASYLVNTANQITATTPAHSAGSALVTVRTASGSSGQPVFFSFQVPAVPLVTGIAPGNGPAPGGTTVVLTGTRFTGATAVRFGAAPAAAFTLDTATRITATTPAIAPGVVLVTVTTPDGTSNGVPFFYLGAPVVSTLSPAQGPRAGGNTVVISGCNLAVVTGVRFGSVSATFTVDSDTQITAVAPPGTGVALVTALSPGGTSAAAYYSYLPAPVVTGLAPAQGPESGGNEVTVTGSGLGLALVVTFGAVPVSFVAYSDALLGAVAPPGTGVVPVVVTTPGGPSAGAPYTYVSPP